MNKKGFLLGEETLKIIIAVICIIFLVYLLFSIYNIHLRNKDLKLAKASLEHLIKEINAGKEEVRIYNPSEDDPTEGWYLTNFPNIVDPTTEVLPKSCYNKGWKSCLCICKMGGVEEAKTPGEQLSMECDKTGFCLENNYNVEYGLLRTDPSPLILSIDHENKTISKKIEIKIKTEEEFGGGGATREF